MEKKFKKIYLTYYNLLIALDLWQAHKKFQVWRKIKGTILLLQQGVYPYEYRDNWKVFTMT